MAKSATFGVLHLGISFGVGYAISGRVAVAVAVAGAITLVEPALNTVVHYFFDRCWHARQGNAAVRDGSVELPHAAPSSV